MHINKLPIGINLNDCIFILWKDDYKIIVGIKIMMWVVARIIWIMEVLSFDIISTNSDAAVGVFFSRLFYIIVF